jgi:integrase
MARQVIGKLSANDVKRAGRGHHSDGKGLYLRVSPTGAKSWAFRYRVDTVLHEMGLGPLGPDTEHPIVSLVEAREKAAAMRKQLYEFREGNHDHPLAAKRAAKVARRVEAAKAMTFRECAERCIEMWNLGQWNASLTEYVYPILGALPVQQVDRTLVIEVLAPIWTEKHVTASRVRQRIEAVLDWATPEYRTGDNPAKLKGLKLPEVKRTTQYHPALPYADIGAFMTALRQQEGSAARALEFAILTAARSAEVVGARWSEINMAERMWTIPAERMKAGKEHRVPLSDAALAILHTMERGVFVFGGARKIARDALLRQLRQIGHDEAVHGFRSTFATWAAERTAFPYEVREMALAHTVGSVVERSYQHSDLFDRRRRLMDDWAAFCGRVEAAEGEVVPLRA